MLFLDRHHDRARAYIDRARSAQAELQRESEAVLHQGIAAFQAGDVANARRLVADALDRGAPRDDAEGMLDRIERLGTGQTAPRPRRRHASQAALHAESRTAAPATHPGRVRSVSAALLLIIAALGVVAVALWGLTLPDPAMLPFFGAASFNDARTNVAPPPSPLPQAAANETYLARSRSLAATGRLRDALHEIDRIPLGDPLRAGADQLRSEIQRQFLAIAAAELPGTTAAEPGPPPRPPE